jgi:predicted GNAT family acetyltransferase
MHEPPEDLELEFADNPDRNRYEARLGTRVVGWSEYTPADGRITFVHTIVARSLEGRGIAGRLVQWALDDVRARGLRIVVECPYVASFLRRHAEYGELVDR